ncbi:MAG TPA: SPFH domain-containing protein [Pseudoneobacillus sp.]|nr:SPFH domain-containing protein [Pseudoneobacillus sp.]
MGNYYGYSDAEIKAMEAKRKRLIQLGIGGGIFGIVLIIALVLIVSSISVIKPGYAGVIYNKNGGIEKTVLTQGWHIISPFKDVTSYAVSTEQGYMSRNGKEGGKDDDSFNIPTKSGKTVNVDMEYSYHFDIEKLPDVFTKFRGQEGKDIESSFMRGKFKAWAGEVSSTYDVIDIYGDKRANLNQAVFEHVKQKFAEFGIIIETLNFSRIDPDPETAKAIQDRVNAEQTLQKLETDKKIAQSEADKKKITAEGDAAAALVKAQNDAEVKRVAAEGEAKANNLLQASMTDKLVEYKKLEVQQAQAEAMSKWQVQTFINGGSQTPLLNIGK